MDFFVLMYFFIGLCLSYAWWLDEYNGEEDLAIEKPMATLYLLGLMFFWPIKAIKMLFNEKKD
jgi:hypothetical protein